MASKRWKDDIAYAMTPFKLISWPIGVWPLQVYNFCSLLRSILSICLSVLLITLCYIELYMGCTSKSQNADCVMLSCSGILAILKIVFFRIHANNLINNYKSAVNDYLTITNMEERIIMRKQAFTARIISLPLILFSYFCCIAYTIKVLMNHDETNGNITDVDIMLEYPIPSKCAMKYFHAPISMYKIFVIIQTYTMIIVTNANIGNDALFLNIGLHICGQMKILKIHFDNIDATCPQIYDRVNELIQRHIYLLGIIRKLADAISFVLLAELFIISISLCVYGFQFIIALKEKDIVLMGQSFMAELVFFVTLTMYSFIGHNLKSQMEDIGYSIYQSAWYNFPNKLTKNVVFILMQTKSPIALQAGNFIPVNLSTYVSILKSSFSYLSVLRIMVEV